MKEIRISTGQITGKTKESRYLIIINRCGTPSRISVETGIARDAYEKLLKDLGAIELEFFGIPVFDDAWVCSKAKDHLETVFKMMGYQVNRNIGTYTYMNADELFNRRD